jgi:hypothetical protein
MHVNKEEQLESMGLTSMNTVRPRKSKWSDRGVVLYVSWYTGGSIAKHREMVELSEEKYCFISHT